MKSVETVSYHAQVPVIGSYDVIVCGGGPAGYVSALAAARNGARVAILEQYSFFGGLATAGLVAPISEFNKNGRRVIQGIPWEVMERLHALGGADLSYPIGNVPYDPELYKLVIQEMLLEAGATPYLCCTLTGCIQENRRITHALCSGKQGGFALRADCFIDCTGDAVLCSVAHVPLQAVPDAAECQPATLCFRLGGVGTAHLENIFLREQNTRYANQRVRRVLEALRDSENVPNFGGPWFCWAMRDGIVNVNMTRAPVNLEDPAEASKMECRLRADAFRLTGLLQKHVPEFKNSFIIETAVQAGYREGRRIAGAHVLTGEELMGGVHFEDTIACAAHPVDIHRPNDTAQDVTFLQQEGFIPYRSLFASGYSNLLVAGRCLSADRVAFASVRVQACAMATGQAAGTAAALCCRQRIPVDALDTSCLRGTLAQQGVIL